MDVSIICSLIEAGGAIIAAVTAAFIAKDIVKKDIKPVLQTYSDSPDNLSSIIENARYNIVIFTALGNKLLAKYGGAFERKLRSGVHVYYLCLNEEKYLEMEQYMHGSNAKGSDLYRSVQFKIKELSSKYPDHFQARTFPHFMTASYIGVDIPFENENGYILPDSIIQVMRYQYHCKASNSPIQYLSPRRKDLKRFFQDTVDSMSDMWVESTKL